MIKSIIYEEVINNQLPPNAELERINDIRAEKRLPNISLISHRRAVSPPIENVKSSPTSAKLTPIMRFKTSKEKTY
jgi:hypothetical protein